MRRVETDLTGVALLEPVVFGDDRGFFMETWNRRTFEGLGIDCDFVQDNHSRSAQWVLRGLHYQVTRPQAKLVRVVAGEVFDVAVDLREDSPTFRRWTGVHLSAANRRQLYVPAGFAHGFLVLSESADLLYKCSDFYDPSGERGLAWNDPAIGIAWPLPGDVRPILSPKDGAYGFLS